jgi:hypothetical protein
MHKYRIDVVLDDGRRDQFISSTTKPFDERDFLTIYNRMYERLTAVSAAAVEIK